MSHLKQTIAFYITMLRNVVIVVSAVVLFLFTLYWIALAALGGQSGHIPFLDHNYGFFLLLAVIDDYCLAVSLAAYAHDAQKQGLQRAARWWTTGYFLLFIPFGVVSFSAMVYESGIRYAFLRSISLLVMACLLVMLPPLTYIVRRLHREQVQKNPGTLQIQ